MIEHDHRSEQFPGPEDHDAAVRHLREMHNQDRDSDWSTLAEEHAALHSIGETIKGRAGAD